MKKFLLPIIFAGLIVSCAGPETAETRMDYNLQVTLNQDIDSWAYLKSRRDREWVVMDSVMVAGRSFTFKGNIAYPERYYIQIPETKSLVPFFIEGSDIVIGINVKNIDSTTILGSQTNGLYERYLDDLLVIDNQIRYHVDGYKKAKESENKDLMQYHDALVDSLQEEKSAFTKEYIIRNNNSPVSPYIAYRNIYQLEQEDLSMILDSLDVSVAASIYTGYLKNRLVILKRVAVGNKFIPFEMEDVNGQMLKLEDISNGKYLLIDFWASWCGPCRNENPNLVECYYDFRKKNLEFLGVSLDNDRDEWIKAINQDNLTWLHVSDLKGWNNFAAQLYGVVSIPSNVLLDPEGIIIARNLRGERLRKTFEELFSE